MSKNKVFYYVTDSIIPHQRYFISYTKKAIRKYSDENNLGIVTVFDPSDKMIDTQGNKFVDLTKPNPDTANNQPKSK